MAYDFNAHVQELEGYIGGKKTEINGPKYGLKCWVYPATVLERQKYLDLAAQGQPALSAITCLLDRGLHENGRQLFPDTESRKAALNGKLSGPFVDLGEAIQAHDAKLMNKSKDKYDEARKNLQGQPESG